MLRNILQVSPASSSCHSPAVAPPINRLALCVRPHLTSIISQTLKPLKRFFTERDIAPDLVGLFNQEVHIIFTSQSAAANAALIWCHFSNYSLALEIKGFSMTLLEESSYATEIACRL